MYLSSTIKYRNIKLLTNQYTKIQNLLIRQA